MNRLLRLATYATYPFLVLSGLLMVGAMGSFTTRFTIENRTASPITVTPVGIGEGSGRTIPLPVKVHPYLPVPAPRAGGYRLGPGESVTIHYDMDDVDFSDLLIEDEGARPFAMPIPRERVNEWGAVHVIDDLSRLGGATPAVREAAAAADRAWVASVGINGLLFGPWLLYGGLALLRRRWERRAGPNPSPPLPVS